MHHLTKGDIIRIPVKVTGGAFAGEFLITFDTMDGPISGFISSDQVRDFDDAQSIPAVVLDVESDRIAVRLHGSFFTTTGLAHISPTDHYERAA
jgi:hypothetical protein